MHMPGDFNKKPNWTIYYLIYSNTLTYNNDCYIINDGRFYVIGEAHKENGLIEHEFRRKQLENLKKTNTNRVLDNDIKLISEELNNLKTAIENYSKREETLIDKLMTKDSILFAEGIKTNRPYLLKHNPIMLDKKFIFGIPYEIDPLAIDLRLDYSISKDNPIKKDVMRIFDDDFKEEDNFYDKRYFEYITEALDLEFKAYHKIREISWCNKLIKNVKPEHDKIIMVMGLAHAKSKHLLDRINKEFNTKLKIKED